MPQLSLYRCVFQLMPKEKYCKNLPKRKKYAPNSTVRTRKDSICLKSWFSLCFLFILCRIRCKTELPPLRDKIFDSWISQLGIYWTDVHYAKLASARRTGTLWAQPSLWFLLVLPWCKPFAHATAAPHWPASTVYTVFFLATRGPTAFSLFRTFPLLPISSAS